MFFSDAAGANTKERGATLSLDRRYRYVLWWHWDLSRPALLFLMLNPSLADEYSPDPTFTRCAQRAGRNGYGGVRIVNLFAFRSPYPSALRAQIDPIGPLNDAYIRAEAVTHNSLVCAWGTNGDLLNRARTVVKGLTKFNHLTLYYLERGKTGHPKHPLHISYDTPLTVWPHAKAEQWTKETTRGFFMEEKK